MLAQTIGCSANTGMEPGGIHCWNKCRNPAKESEETGDKKSYTGVFFTSNASPWNPHLPSKGTRITFMDPDNTDGNPKYSANNGDQDWKFVEHDVLMWVR